MGTLTSAESHLMQIIWEKGNISSGELVKESQSRLGWKKSTTYTILKKIIEKGIAVNENSNVRPLISNEEYNNNSNGAIIDKYFSGSLPEFMLSFVKEKKLSKKEVEELEKIIRDYKEELDD